MRALLAAVSFSLLAGAANAAVISQTINLNPNNFNTEYGEAIVSPTPFDNSLGMLTSISGDLSIVFTETYHTGFGVNTAPQQVPFTTHLDVLLNSTSSRAPTQQVTGIIDTNNLVTVSDSFRDYMFFAPASSFFPDPSIKIDTYAIGTGNTSAPIDTPFEQVGARLIVSFNYTPVPEPASLALLAVGVAGMATIGRRRSLLSRR